MKFRHCYDLEVNSDRSENVRYSYTDLPIGFFNGKHSKYANNSMPAHWHEDIEIFVPNEGEVIYNINGRLVTVSVGEGLLVNSRRIHSSSTKEMRDCYYNLLIFHPMVLCFSKEIEQKVVQPIIGSSFDYILLKKDVPWHNNILHWFSLIKERHVDKHLPRPFAPMEFSVFKENDDKSEKCAVTGLVSLIWSELAGNITPDEKPHAECEQLSSMKSMIAFIDKHYTEKISLEDIATAGLVSKRTCGNLFERFLYISPMKYLNEQRLKHSIELLRETDMTITEIALAVGFSGASYYAEAFRRETGKSPTEYRSEFETEISL
ncbi:MAG: AraC family transcriptional regulator [Oscillospiraceae bacterium]|nr:AraC family transcriptional regulator [Oscillospiraceae bacterium]